MHVQHVSPPCLFRYAPNCSKVTKSSRPVYNERKDKTLTFRAVGSRHAKREAGRESDHNFKSCLVLEEEEDEVMTAGRKRQLSISTCHGVARLTVPLPNIMHLGEHGDNFSSVVARLWEVVTIETAAAATTKIPARADLQAVMRSCTLACTRPPAREKHGGCVAFG